MIRVKFSGGCTNSLQLSLLLSMGMSKEHQGQYLADSDVDALMAGAVEVAGAAVELTGGLGMAKAPTTRPGTTAMVRRLRSRWRSMVTAFEM